MNDSIRQDKNHSEYNRMPSFGKVTALRIHEQQGNYSMAEATSNIISRIEREYTSFLYDQYRRTSNNPITIEQIREFIKSPDGKKGLESFKQMRSQKTNSTERQPQRIGEFL